MKLTEEQKDQLRDLMSSDAWGSVLILCEMAVRKHEDKLLECAAEPRALLISKARLDGARAVVNALKGARKELKLDEG